MKLKENRSATKNYLLCIVTFFIFNIFIVFDMAKELNKRSLDKKNQTNPALHFIIALLVPFIGYIYWLIYRFTIINKMEEYVKENGVFPKLNATSWILGEFFGIFTLYIWPLINFTKKIALWNQCNKIYNSNIVQKEKISEV